MDSITLAKAKKIAEAINAYGEKNSSMDFSLLAKFVEKRTGASKDELSEVVQFLQEIQGAAETIPIYDNEALTIAERVKQFVDRPVDLAKEIQYNYGVARALLDMILSRGNVPDNEEVRRTLREISRFSDAMLKMQERVFNIQQMQLFQEMVLQLLEDTVPEVREKAAMLLLESDL